MKKILLISLIFCLIISILSCGLFIFINVEMQKSPFRCISTTNDYTITDNDNSYSFSATFLNASDKDITFTACFPYYANDTDKTYYLEREITVPKSERGCCGKLNFYEEIITLEDYDTVFANGKLIEYDKGGQNNLLMTQENLMIINFNDVEIFRKIGIIISVIFVVVTALSLTTYLCSKKHKRI